MALELSQPTTRRRLLRSAGMVSVMCSLLLAACGGAAAVSTGSSVGSAASSANTGAASSSPASSGAAAVTTSSAVASTSAASSSAVVSSSSAAPVSSVVTSTTASATSAAALSASTAAASAPAAAGLKISFLNWYTTSVVGADTAKVLGGLLDTYKQRTGVTVENVGAGFSDVSQKLLAGVAANDPPDASFSSIIWGRDWYDQGILADIDSFVAQAADVQGDKFFAASKQFRQTCGHTFGLPVMGPESLIFWVDQNKLQAAGFDPMGKDLKTWDDLARGAQKLTKTGPDGKITLAGLATTGSLGIAWLTAWTETTGHSLFDAEQNAAYYNAPETVSAVQFLVDLANKDNVAPPLAEKGRPANLAAIGTGKAAMALDETEPGDQFQYVNSNLWMAPLPAAPTAQGQAATATWLNFMVMPKNGKHIPEAFQPIRFLAGFEAQVQLELFPPGAPPSLAPRFDFYDSPQWKQALKDHPNLQGAVDIAKLPGVYPYHRFTDQNKQIAPLLQKACTAQMDVKTALDQAQQFATQILAPKQ